MEDMRDSQKAVLSFFWWSAAERMALKLLKTQRHERSEAAQNKHPPWSGLTQMVVSDRRGQEQLHAYVGPTMKNDSDVNFCCIFITYLTRIQLEAKSIENIGEGKRFISSSMNLCSNSLCRLKSLFGKRISIRR